MHCINTWNELLEITSCFREKGESITNFYPNEAEMTEWIEKGSFLFAELNEKAACLAHRTNEANFLFFYITNMSELSQALILARSKFLNEKLAFDWICRNEEESKLLHKECAQGGFSLHASLQRMSRVLNENLFESVSEIEFANEQDVDELHAMFCLSFDSISERVPSKERVAQYIKSKNILVKREQNEIAGFAVIDIQKKTMYLKHLLTNQKFRRQGIADSLLRKAFFLSKGCIRYILWVIKENKPAINLYRKFGYEFETLSNYTFVTN